MIHNISIFNFVPDMQITMSSDRYLEQNKKEITLELDLLEQAVLLQALHNHFKKLKIEDKEVNNILKNYMEEQPECIVDWIKDITTKNEM